MHGDERLLGQLALFSAPPAKRKRYVPTYAGDFQRHSRPARRDSCRVSWAQAVRRALPDDDRAGLGRHGTASCPRFWGVEGYSAASSAPPRGGSAFCEGVSFTHLV